MTSRLAWLEGHAPLTVPTSGCTWLPPAPGCARPAWVCTASWSETGGAGGSYGQDAVFDTDPVALAELRKRPTDQRMAPEPGEGETLVPISVDDPELGPVFQLSRSEEAYGGPIYGMCIKEWEEAEAAACDAVCAAQAKHGEFALWKGHSAAEARCSVKAEKASGSTGLRSCVVILADACTGRVGLDCEGEKPRFTTPSFQGSKAPP